METLKAKKKNGQMDFLLYVTVLLLCAFAHRRQISLDGNALLAPLVADLIAIRNRTGIVQLLIDNGHLRAVRFAKNQPRAAVFAVLHHNVRRAG